MLATILDNHWVYIEQASPEQINTFIRAFSVKDPKSYYIDTGSNWDGWYRKFDTKKCRIALPLLNDLLVCCQENNYPIEVNDTRPPCYQVPDEEITPNLLQGVTLENYQIEAIKACCKNEIGLISISTGGGKTEVMCALIKLFKCNTVVMTEQTVVLEQIVERLQLRNVIKSEEIGMFCSGCLPDSDNIVLVGNVQSLNPSVKPKYSQIKLTREKVLEKILRLLENGKRDELKSILPKDIINSIEEDPQYIESIPNSYVEIAAGHFRAKEFDRRTKWYNTRSSKAEVIYDLVGKCDLLLVDEADLAVKPQYINLCKNIYNGRRRFGFSGTPFESSKPVENLILRENLGNIIYEVSRNEVQSCNRIIPIKSYFIIVGADGDRYDCRAYDIAMSEEMVNNEKFHKLVTKINENFKNEKSLILLDTSPIGPIGESLKELIPGSRFIWNKSSNKERNECINAFENNKLQCLIASRIAKRGLDLHGGLDNLIVIASSKQWSNVNQMIGRAVRLNSRGWARVFFFFFLNNRYLYKHSKEALKAVISLGYPAKILYNGKMIDGEIFIKSKYQLKYLHQK